MSDTTQQLDVEAIQERHNQIALLHLEYRGTANVNLKEDLKMKIHVLELQQSLDNADLCREVIELRKQLTVREAELNRLAREVADADLMIREIELDLESVSFNPGSALSYGVRDYLARFDEYSVQKLNALAAYRLAKEGKRP